jgi:2-keto-4-pentenoate hydratase
MLQAQVVQHLAHSTRAAGQQGEACRTEPPHPRLELEAAPAMQRMRDRRVRVDRRENPNQKELSSA